MYNDTWYKPIWYYPFTKNQKKEIKSVVEEVLREHKLIPDKICNCKYCTTSTTTLSIVPVLHQNFSNGSFYVKCPVCKFSSPERKTKQEAVMVWNNLNYNNVKTSTVCCK